MIFRPFDYWRNGVFSHGDYDPKAKGVRDKPRNFETHMAEFFNTTAIMFQWDTKETEIPIFRLEQYLQCYGWVAVITKNGKKLVVSGNCAGWLGEWTEYYMPAGIIVANPYAQEFNGQYYFSDDNCILIRNDSEFLGLYPMFARACEMLVENDITILNALENLRIMNIYYAEDSNTANAFAQMQKNLKWGKLSTVLQTVKSWMSGETKPLGVLPVNGVCTTYMQQLIEIATYIKGQLYNSIGLQSNWNMKRQALSENEIGANNDILKPLVQNMLMCRQDAAKKLGWTVKLNDTWKHVEEQEDSANESTDIVPDNDRDNNENAGDTMEQQP